MYSETSTYEGAPSFAVLACGSRPAKGGAAHLFSSPSVDGDGRRTSTTLPNGVAMNYSYDVASELTGITYMLGSNTLGTLSYAYDAAGRRTGVGGSYARTGVPQAASSATYNVNNQLTNWKGATLTYDANGNLTSDGTNTYTWNARNQLVSISGGVNASFQYDPFGRRVSKTIGGTTQFLYDGANPVQEISGSSASANLLTGGVDEYFQRTDSAGARDFLTDALGSTLALADSTGTLQTSYTFEPFGNTSFTGSTTTNSFAYTGRELDATGLYFYRARYYNPSLQRFIAEDPIAFAGGDNLYTYVGDSPTNFWDPLGLIRDPAGLPIGRLPIGGGEAPMMPIAGRKKTCLQLFLNTALHPEEGPLGPDFENVVQNVQAGFQALGAGLNFLAIDVHNSALDYGAALSAAASAAGTISYPFRSTIFKGLVNLSENLSSLSESLSSDAVAGETGLLALDILLGNALANEVEAVRSGECIPEGVALKRIIFNQ